MSYFDDALANFTKDFAYGGAIRHLADHGYTADRIKREFGYPMPVEEIDRIVRLRVKENEERAEKGGL